MCARLVGVKTKAEMDDRIAMLQDPGYWKHVNQVLKDLGWNETYNWPPTDVGPIIKEGDNGVAEIGYASWGFNHKYGPGHNAKEETVHELVTFRRAFHEQRAVIPVLGWYEWTGPKSARVPYFLHRGTALKPQVFFMAGLWRYSEDKGAYQFTIITADARGGLEEVHNRMPDHLIRDWLNVKITDTSSIKLVLDRAIEETPQGVSWHSVGKVVGNDPELILPI